MRPTRKQVQAIIVAMTALLVGGAVVFSLGEHVSYAEGLYRSVYVVLAHHDNFGARSSASKAMVLTLILASLLVIVYLLKALAEYMMGLGDNLKRRQMKAKIAKMQHHYVVCGLGRVGSQVVQELAAEGVDFVGLDIDEEKVKDAIAHGYVAFVGDSTREEVLRSTGIDRARGLIACLGEDSNNLFVTLAARQMNPHLYIVARANRFENKQRLEAAGANRVAMPYQIGGYHMATMMIRPNIVDFLEVMSSNHHHDLQIAELVVPADSFLVGQRLDWLPHHNVRATVLAINTNRGHSRVNPSGHETIAAGDKLILMGTPTQLQEASARI